ncbi:MAG: hypothetical protein AAFW68_03120 [Pseudomonadota bacterium]
MRFVSFLAGFSAVLFSSGAIAHPGSNILTVGSGAERSAMTAGVTFEEDKGVHIFRGNARRSAVGLLGDEPIAAKDARATTIRVEIRKRPWRTIRRLRTQGFYSGVPYPSRPYTQGFYSIEK